MSLYDDLKNFMSKDIMAEEHKDKIYNEYSLQFELGYYLRDKGYNVFVEKNIKGTKAKHRTDLFIEDKNNNKNYAIELKYPRNGQCPEQMHQFIKDIKFMEEVVDRKLCNTAYCLTLVDDKRFYSKGNETNDKDTTTYYDCFRGLKDSKIKIKGTTYNNPTGKKKGEYSFKLSSSYESEWEDCPYVRADGKNIKYYLISINKNSLEKHIRK